MIEGLSLSNIKSFSDSVTLRCAPLTVLCGTNSCGKSTVFQALLLLKQAFESPSRLLAGCYLNGKYVSLGGFDEWVASWASTTPRLPEISVAVVPHQPGAAWNTPASPAHARLPTFRNSLSRPLTRTSWTFRFAQSPHSPGYASLHSLLYTSASYGNGGELLDYSSTAFERSPDALGSIPEVLRAPFSPETFCYTATERLLPETAEPALRDRRAVALPETYPVSIEGLVPTRYVVKTEDKAALETLRSALERVLPESLLALAQRPQYPPMTTSAARIPSVSFDVTSLSAAQRLLRLAHSRRYTDQRFLRFVLAQRPEEVTAFLFARPDSGGKGENAQRRNRVAIQAAQAWVQRLIALMPATLAGTSPRPVGDEDAPKSGTPEYELCTAWPAHSAPIRLLSTIAARGPTSDLREHAANALHLAVRVGKQLAFEERPWDERALRDHRFRRFHGRMRYWSGPQGRVFVNRLFYLGPLREEPRNLYTTEPPADCTDVGKRGERTIACLYRFGEERVLAPLVPTADSEPRAGDMPLQQAVALWARYLGIADMVDVASPTKFGTVCRIAVPQHSPDGDGYVRPDLVNVGVGVSQLLPVLVLCLGAPNDSTILIEQPELHLHPRVQSRLAVFFHAISTVGRQVVLETHSEHFINGLRLLAAQGRLRGRSDLALWFLERDEDGTSAREVTLGDDGSIGSWPKGFMDEAESVISEIVRLRLERR